jgi:hypothetical protein
MFRRGSHPQDIPWCMCKYSRIWKQSQIQNTPGLKHKILYPLDKGYSACISKSSLAEAILLTAHARSQPVRWKGYWNKSLRCELSGQRRPKQSLRPDSHAVGVSAGLLTMKRGPESTGQEKGSLSLSVFLCPNSSGGADQMSSLVQFLTLGASVALGVRVVEN